MTAAPQLIPVISEVRALSFFGACAPGSTVTCWGMGARGRAKAESYHALFPVGKVPRGCPTEGDSQDHEQTRDFKLELAGITKPHLSQSQEVGRRHVDSHSVWSCEQVVWEPDTRGRTPCQLNMRLGKLEQSLTGSVHSLISSDPHQAWAEGCCQLFGFFRNCWICHTLHSSAVLWSLRLWALLFPVGTFGMSCLEKTFGSRDDTETSVCHALTSCQGSGWSELMRISLNEILLQKVSTQEPTDTRHSRQVAAIYSPNRMFWSEQGVNHPSIKWGLCSFAYWTLEARRSRHIRDKCLSWVMRVWLNLVTVALQMIHVKFWELQSTVEDCHVCKAHLHIG